MLFGLLPGCGHGRRAKNGPFSAFNPLGLMIEIYQGPLDGFSAVRRGTCPMYPSCSQYCLEAARKHGPLIGWIMGCDRLMRCGRNELDLSPWIRTADGEWKCYDPVEHNDFWWDGEDASDR
jgi:putative component of membrane protein insertase Oxa1/YidC/SpoIIIJ protein YidD